VEEVLPLFASLNIGNEFTKEGITKAIQLFRERSVSENFDVFLDAGYSLSAPYETNKRNLLKQRKINSINK